MTPDGLLCGTKSYARGDEANDERLARQRAPLSETVVLFADQPVKCGPHDAVALAGRLFQAATIHDRNAPASVADQSGALQRPGDHRYPGTARPEHFREKLMRDIEFIALDAVVRHEQPATATLLDRMKPITGRELRHEGK